MAWQTQISRGKSPLCLLGHWLEFAYMRKVCTAQSDRNIPCQPLAPILASGLASIYSRGRSEKTSNADGSMDIIFTNPRSSLVTLFAGYLDKMIKMKDRTPCP